MATSPAPQRTAILVVDDEFLIRWATGRLLAEHGWTVVEAGTIAEAMAVFERDTTVRGVVLDIRLPDGSGLDLLKRMKASRPGCAVVMISAHGSDQDAQQALQSGALRLLSKPFDGRELIDLLDDALT